MGSSSSADDDASTTRLKVFMLPWLAHGHISPYLELAKRLAKRNIFIIYLCSTQINLQSIKKKLLDHQNHHHSSSSLNYIQQVELQLPASADLPPHQHTTNGLPPHLMGALGDAFQRSHPNLSTILEELKPDIVIHEIMHPWVGELASSLHIPAIDFLTASASTISFFTHMMTNPGVEYPLPGLYLHEFERIKIFAQAASASKHSKNRHLNSNSDDQHPKTLCKITLIKSCMELEGSAIDYYSALTKKKVIPVGPLTEDPTGSKSDDDDNTEVIEWLNKKEKSSTVFVSFGSEYFLSKEEMEEIAYGLELSDVNFIWVVRFPKQEAGSERIIKAVEDELPKGFLERVGERGLVLNGWAPQVEILSHESVGGFVSHCGWGSAMESMKLGVPIIAVPMHLDQPLNARMMVELGVAVEVVRDENGRIQREEVGKVTRQVVAEEGGESVRRKAKEMGEKLRSKGEEEIDALVEELVRTCEGSSKGKTNT